MDVRRIWMMGVGCGIALLAPLAAIAAESDQLRATIEKPAVVTASPPTASASQPSNEVVLSVTGYQPPQDGAVQVVVKAQKADGSEQQIGTIGLFPDRPFTVDASRPRTFNIPLPQDLARSGPLKLKLELVPLRGKGEGARLEVGGAQIR